MKPDNNPVLDTSFPAVIGCDGYQYEQIGSVISPGRRMESCKDHPLMTLLFHTAGRGKRKTQAKHTNKTVCLISDGDSLSILLKRYKPVNIG